MKKGIGALLFLVLLASMTLVAAGTTKIMVRMDDDYGALIRVKDGETVIETPSIKNYPMGLAEFSYDTSRSQADYLIMIHESGNVVDSYVLNDLDTGSNMKVDFREGVPPIITDLNELAQQEAEEVEEEVAEIASENVSGENNSPEYTETQEPSFDFTKGFSTGKAVFYSDEGFTVFSWILLGIIVLGIVVWVFSSMRKHSREEVDKYKDELESIRTKIRKKIREIKILKARGMKLKKMIELEEGILEEKSELRNVEKEVDLEDEKKKKKE